MRFLISELIGMCGHGKSCGKVSLVTITSEVTKGTVSRKDNPGYIEHLGYPGYSDQVERLPRVQSEMRFPKHNWISKVTLGIFSQKVTQGTFVQQVTQGSFGPYVTQGTIGQ